MGAADTAGAAGTAGVVGAVGAAGTAGTTEAAGDAGNAGADRRAGSAGGAASAIDVADATSAAGATDVADAASAAGADRRAGGRGSDATPVTCFARASAHQHADGKNKAKCTLLFERWQIKGRNALFFWDLTAHHSFSETASWENSATAKAKAPHACSKSCISAISCHSKNTSVHFDDNLPDKRRPRSKERPMRTQYAARAKKPPVSAKNGSVQQPRDRPNAQASPPCTREAAPYTTAECSIAHHRRGRSRKSRP